MARSLPLLQTNGSRPDALARLVRLLARQAAAEHHRATAVSEGKDLHA